MSTILVVRSGHQQAQVHHLETVLSSSPRQPIMPNDLATMSRASPTPSLSSKMQRRTSFEVLQGIAGPDSNLPLPSRLNGLDDVGSGSIREGVPMSFGLGNSQSHLSPSKRTSSPTRTLSRNARALADEGGSYHSTSPGSNGKLAPIDTVDLTSSSYLTPPSPNRRQSLTPGGTTKVLADLQTGVTNARNALENTKAQLRLSQRTVAQLTRQTEDLKEGRERLRLENEGLNNVVARKERLLQELLDRARKAEGEAAALKAQLKSETTSSKKSLKEMEGALSESTALSQKSEREYLTLRDSIRGMTEGWKADVGALREELKLREEEKERSREVEEAWVSDIKALREEVEENTRKSEKDAKLAQHLSEELARLRKLIQAAGRTSTPED
ncbi:hypothetical protein BDV98DRAFT_562559 [Pterulicium gracile]|uniref:SWI5-dependent HO expression protein 3 n=1 Tax=Pterulicium gracile TaxID=1884261 RepID=A0A5C3QUW3_9AGAR|nr:hypothetical protein BDV98DRAFT_562559 [Pterula gracilis]